MAVSSRPAQDHTQTVVWSGAGFAFVGRERETGLLLAAVGHPPAVVMVEGEAGIGKSRLVHEAAAAVAAGGGHVLTGLCHPLREPYPYGPVIDALRKAGDWLPPAGIPPSAGALAPLLPDLAALLPASPPPAADAHAKRYQLVNGLRSFLTVLGSAVLVIEDAHWLDEATRELLLLLTRDMPEQLSLVLTYRNEDLPPGVPVLGPAYRRQPGVSGAAIHLNPLSGVDIQALATAALGSHATPELGSVLYQRSEGLPLAAEEDLITLAERGPGERRGPPGDLLSDLEHAEVPRGLREAFTERLSALSPAARTVVEAAAVLDVPTSEQLLVQVTDLDPEQVSRGLTEALRVAVLQEMDTDRYSFRHILAQRVAYEQMPGPLRSRLHRRAIAVLEAQSPPPLVQIAHHSRHLGDRQAWLDRAEAAASQAIRLGDSGTAAALLHAILEQAGIEGERRSSAALALASIAVNGADYVTDSRALRRILADPQLPTEARGEIRLSLGLLMVSHAGDRAGFQEVARAAEELAARPERAARAMIAMAMNERDGGVRQAWAWVERAEAAAGAQPRPGGARRGPGHPAHPAGPAGRPRRVGPHRPAAEDQRRRRGDAADHPGPVQHRRARHRTRPRPARGADADREPAAGAPRELPAHGVLQPDRAAAPGRSGRGLVRHREPLHRAAHRLSGPRDGQDRRGVDHRTGRRRAGAAQPCGRAVHRRRCLWRRGVPGDRGAAGRRGAHSPSGWPPRPNRTRGPSPNRPSRRCGAPKPGPAGPAWSRSRSRLLWPAAAARTRRFWWPTSNGDCGEAMLPQRPPSSTSRAVCWTARPMRRPRSSISKPRAGCGPTSGVPTRSAARPSSSAPR